MGILKNLAFVQNAQYYPCAKPDPFLIVQAAGAAAFPVLLNAVSFSCLDIIKMRGGISPWHSRGLRALIDGAIPPAQSDQVNKIYKFLIPLEKTLFFFFVVELTTEFFARWQSQIFRLGACGDDPRTCLYDGDTPVWFNTPEPRWAPIQYHVVHNSGPCLMGNVGTISVPAGSYFSCNFTLGIRAQFNNRPPTNVSTILREFQPSHFDYHEQNTPAPWIGNKINATYHLDARNRHATPAHYIIEAKADQPCVSDGGSIHVEISSLPIFENSIIPVNCFGAAASPLQSP